MTIFLVGLALFLGTHSLQAFAPGARQGLQASMGEGAFKGLYSIISLVGFVMLIYGYPAAQGALPNLYPVDYTKHIALLLMLPVFPLLLATYLPGRIKAAVKHPMLTAVKAWALAHLLANGTGAAVLLFGSFLAWAVLVRISIKRRSGDRPPTAPGSIALDFIAVALGLGLYVAFIFGLHQWLFGVAPIASLAYGAGGQ